MHSLTDRVDCRRQSTNCRLDPKRKTAYGQYMTARPVAQFMASLFGRERIGPVRLLDAGAGVGSLTAAFVEEFCQREGAVPSISASSYETEPIMVKALQMTLTECTRVSETAGMKFTSDLLQTDFIEAGASHLLSNPGPLFANLSPGPKFTHAILNPPYKKIRSDSAHRQLLRSVGIETSNLYTGFLSLAIKMLVSNGEMVAITPRSFCNGPYFKPFRELLLDEMNLKHIHVFESRTDTFRDDEVLQESIIFHAVKRQPQAQVTISTSEGADFARLRSRIVEFNQVIQPQAPEQFIHINTDEGNQRFVELMYALPNTLQDLKVNASTGPVVDFRLRRYLRTKPEPETVPLIYPAHCRSHFVEWPASKGKKSNAIMDVDSTQKWLYPNGHYTVVRRFSSKEERRRVVASIHDPSTVPGKKIGFENHLNVFHQEKQGLTQAVARGLAVYLNSTFYDVCFRQFSGHTQVNVKDLLTLRYPDLAALERLGERIEGFVFPSQKVVDSWIEQELF